MAVVVAVVSLHSRTSAAAAGPSFWNSVGFPALWLNDELLLKVLGHDASLRIAMIFKRIRLCFSSRCNCWPNYHVRGQQDFSCSKPQENRSIARSCNHYLVIEESDVEILVPATQNIQNNGGQWWKELWSSKWNNVLEYAAVVTPWKNRFARKIILVGKSNWSSERKWSRKRLEWHRDVSEASNVDRNG